MNESTACELWLVRHGETAENARGRLLGWRDEPLSAHGRAQAQALAVRLRPVTFTSASSSDLARARETARLAYGDVPGDRRLREIDFGALEGATYVELPETVQHTLRDFETFAAPAGESVADLRARVLEFTAELGPGRHLVFTHGGVIRLFCHLLGHTTFVAPATITVIDWAARRVVRLGEAAPSARLAPPLDPARVDRG